MTSNSFLKEHPLNSLSSHHTLSAAEFAVSIEALEITSAVFDCDGTLWSLDSGSAFMEWSIQTGLISSELVDWLNDRYRRYGSGELNEFTICGDMVKVYQGLQEADVRDAAARFFPAVVEPSIFPDLLRTVRLLQERGVEIWAVSSTNQWVVEEGVKRFGIPADRVLAARVGVDRGILSDRIIEVPTDEDKVKALKRKGVEHPGAVFGNSIHDAAMLAIASHPFPVNPSRGLEEKSVAMGWRVFFPTA